MWLYNIKPVDRVSCLCYPTKKKRQTTNAVQFISVQKDEDLCFSTWRRSHPCSLEICIWTWCWNFM